MTLTQDVKLNEGILQAFWNQWRFDAAEHFNFSQPLRYRLENIES